MNWIEQDGTLQKEFSGDSFADIINRLQRVAVVADGMDHHPDFKVYGYKNIKFKLCTHSEGKVTDKDYTLAKNLDEIFE
ncbi:4a-hydroxytetrahydrobiopterin dehydratase [Crocinitomix catalasitica]|nr:4a-hydroxytetrahydrobiopterin dehydratase [Crocinitomix catalasitica]